MSAKNKGSLKGLMIAQFTGAFNDNAFKWILVLIATQVAMASGDVGAATENQIRQHYMTMALIVFSLPMMLLSLPAAWLADRFSKRTLIVAMKFAEMVFMLLAAATLYLYPEGHTTAFVLLALMGVQSAIFSPAKYGILPEVLPHEKLTHGNAMIELFTMLAIILGAALGAPFSPWGYWGVGILLVLAIIGFVASLSVPPVSPARDKNASVLGVYKEAFSAIKQERSLLLTIVGLTYFYALVSMLVQNVSIYVPAELHISDTLSGLPMAASGVGIIVGCLMASRLSGEKVEMGLIPLGALITMISVAPLGHWHSFTLTLILMLFTGVGSGLLIVALQSLLQWKSPAACRGAIIALSNVTIVGGVMAGSLLANNLATFDFSIHQIFICVTALTFAGTLWALWMLPQALTRLVLLILTHTVYRMKVIDAQHVPSTGGCLLVPNHVSLADGLFVMAAVDRPVRFLVDAGFFHHPLLKPVMKLLNAIPISSSGGPRVVMRALKDAGAYLEQGDVVCIFAEGQITRTGTMQPFQRGMSNLTKGRDIPIIPIHLDRVWGSVFSQSDGGYLKNLPDSIPYPVTISFGAPLDGNTSPYEVQSVIHNLGQAAWEHRRDDLKPLHHNLVHNTRFWRGCLRFGIFKLCLADSTVPRLNRFQALTGAIALGHRLGREWRGQERVGILLPPSVGCALTNIAASLAGRTSVNLNYTAGQKGVDSAIEQSGISTIVTHQEFLDKVDLALPDGIRVIFIDNEIEQISRFDRMRAGLLTLAASVRGIEKYCGATREVSIDDTATIIFSSGSTAEPKGVMLSHYNIASNALGVSQYFQARNGERMLGILPLFHSFGYMTTWYALHHNVGLVFHSNPVDAARVGELVEGYGISFLLATPTFLQLYLRRVTPGQFGSLRMVMTGAEKLPDRLVSAFEKTFGIRPLEGYGTTECAPVVAMNTLDFRAAGFYQAGSKRGSVGAPLPGVSVKFTDPESGQEVAKGEEGLLWVKGPNVMQGYLNKPELTDEVLKEGWYNTGDMARLDEQGFLFITGRLSRCSKIGGEMVPHGAVEDALHEAAQTTQTTFAVTALPDDKKGEKLCVIHTHAGEIGELIECLKQKGLPNLFVPAPANFIKVDELPLLGSGKLDLRQLKQIAIQNLNL